MLLRGLLIILMHTFYARHNQNVAGKFFSDTSLIVFHIIKLLSIAGSKDLSFLVKVILQHTATLRKTLLPSCEQPGP